MLLFYRLFLLYVMVMLLRKLLEGGRLRERRRWRRLVLLVLVGVVGWRDGRVGVVCRR